MSDATTRANKKDDDVKLPSAIDIHFSNIIHHGPIILTKKTNQFKLARAFIESSIVKPDVPIHFSSLWKFGGNKLTLANAEKMKININGDNDTAVIIQGLDAKQMAKHDSNKLETHLVLAAFDAYDKTEGQLKIQNVSHDSSFKKVKFHFWSGHGETKIGSMKVNSSKNDNFEMQGFVLTQSADVDNDRAKGDMALSINSININNVDYGKQKISISIDNMDIAALNTLSEAVEEQRSKSLPLLPFGRTYRALFAFLSKGAHLSLHEFDVNTKWGRVNADADIKIVQSTTNHGSFQEVMNNLKAAANILFPNQFVHEASKMYILMTAPQNEISLAKKADDPSIAAEKLLQTWIDAGWLVKDSDNFKLQLRVENSEVFINNKLFRFPPAPTITSSQPPAPTTMPTKQPGTKNGQ